MDDGKNIRQHMDAFVVYKKTLGYVYDTPVHCLKRYVDYAQKADEYIVYPEKAITDNYLKEISNAPGTLYGTIAVLREFSRYLQMMSYSDAYIIPPKAGKQPTPEPPYFFTQKECDDFFRALDTIEDNPSFKGRELVIPALFHLLYCCGLRCKEARTLRFEDVHLDQLYLDILQSKGPRSRRIFISSELAEYLKSYNNSIEILFPERIYFFPSKDGCYGSSTISSNFRQFWKKAYPDFVMTTRPRAYDFRHHFAWVNFNKWAAEGMDINVMSAYLMRYMGHQTISETLYYFHFVPEFFPTFKKMTGSLEDMLPEVWDEE